MFGDKLKSALEHVFNDYRTEAVAEKLAPLLNSQRNDALNSIAGSKNPKIRFYGGSKSSDFRVACGVAQHNLRYEYVNRTLEELNIHPGNFCLTFNQKRTEKVLKDKIRKSTKEFQRRRAQIRSQNCSQTARKGFKEGKTYETGKALNLDPTCSTTSTSLADVQARALTMPLNQFKLIENSVPQYTPRSLARHISYEKDNSTTF